MIRKIFTLGLLSFLALGAFGLVGVGSANAQTATFPSGCTSALGYSVTNGLPCNGTSSATASFLPGCSSALGYSITNGVPCSGGSVAIQYLAGCSSIQGYSIISGAACNGTNVAYTSGSTTPTGGIVITIPDPIVIGLPVTGAAGDALLNSIVLAVTGMFVVLGGLYVAKRS
jgi:hypothetical protein